VPNSDSQPTLIRTPLEAGLVAAIICINSVIKRVKGRCGHSPRVTQTLMSG
jgi:hypothetical protein